MAVSPNLGEPGTVYSEPATPWPRIAALGAYALWIDRIRWRRATGKAGTGRAAATSCAVTGDTGRPRLNSRLLRPGVARPHLRGG
jgi:hypothetical protein